MSLDTQIVLTSEAPTVIPPRSGTSPIGTTSPNSGTAANTNSSYAGGAFTSGVNSQTATAYTVQNTDYGGYILFNTASAVAVALNQAVGTNFTTTIFNIGTGAITLTPNGSLKVNGASSLALGSGQGVQVFFANRAWQAFTVTTVIQVVPQTFNAVTHEWLNSYSASTGLFTATQPAYSDISGTPTLPANTPAVTHQFVTAYNSSTGVLSQAQPAFGDVSGTLSAGQLPAAGLSVTITTAKLTAGGTQGSMTFVSGQLTAQTPAT